MRARKFSLSVDDFFSSSSGSMTFGGRAAPRPGSRAERLHRGRTSIDRRRIRLGIQHRVDDEEPTDDDDARRQRHENQTEEEGGRGGEGRGGRRGGEGKGGQTSEQTMNNWTVGRQNTNSNSLYAADGDDSSRHSGNVSIDEWQELEAVTSTKVIRQNESTFSVEQRTVKQTIVVSSGYADSDDAKTTCNTRGPASCLRSLRFVNQWLPRCGSDREPESIKGFSSRETGRQDARPRPTGERSSTQERKTDEEPPSSLQESSPAKTIIQQKDYSGRKFSSSTNSLLFPSVDRNYDSDINRSYSFSNCLSDCFRTSDPRENESIEQQQSRSSTTKIASKSLGAETQTAYNPSSSSSSSSSSNNNNNNNNNSNNNNNNRSSTTASIEAQLEPSSRDDGRDYSGESPFNFRIKTNSMHGGDFARETPHLHWPNAAINRTTKTTMTPTSDAEKESLDSIQKELTDSQRLAQQPEIDRSLSSTMATDDLSQTNRGRLTSFEAAASDSYVDTSAPVPMFKASVDVRGFPPEAICVHFDRYKNEVMVKVIGCCEGEKEEKEEETKGTRVVQTIPLPRYADDTQMMARINGDGILGIEIPLLFYFPEESKTSQSLISRSQ